MSEISWNIWCRFCQRNAKLFSEILTKTSFNNSDSLIVFILDRLSQNLSRYNKIVVARSVCSKEKKDFLRQNIVIWSMWLQVTKQIELLLKSQLLMKKRTYLFILFSKTHQFMKCLSSNSSFYLRDIQSLEHSLKKKELNIWLHNESVTVYNWCLSLRMLDEASDLKNEISSISL